MMILRPANIIDIVPIYMMGYDVWGGQDSEDTYIEACEASEKYKQGSWYCLEKNNELVSSLISYKNCFGLSEKYCGLGSIATAPTHRRKGYAMVLIAQYLKLLKSENMAGIFLFSDINPYMYSKFGFTLVENYEDQGLMYLSLNGSGAIEIPKYF